MTRQSPLLLDTIVGLVGKLLGQPPRPVPVPVVARRQPVRFPGGRR